MNKIDELNNLITETVEQIQSASRQETIDSLLDLLIMAYVFGVNDVNGSIGTNFEPNLDQMQESIYRPIDGETWVDRIDDGNLATIATTESHRVFSEAQYNTAIEGKATHKTWRTMEDEKVRDTHWYLDGLTIGIDEYFYTMDGDYAMRPYDFLMPSNNINCRCVLEYTKEKR